MAANIRRFPSGSRSGFVSGFAWGFYPKPAPGKIRTTVRPGLRALDRDRSAAPAATPPGTALPPA